ncbi:nucleotidyltransferase family protein [Reichenbachiella carrageenanivorans]|uniref:Nucleotidyltransferase family protein n=1 Tax=Reichenbachiella carrageenanivorans TaxID=2979869 RepID=A0ABY6D6W6_9BACT|nr:nucleotidyltransferase family protein [Reichenbachiella carrageenanivorans]UXX80818.1 nucleotidyltransferase family protein [Reichenbachiella carrageenanivorans]
MKSHTDFWPNAKQLYLLKACTLTGTAAIKNYNAWKSTLKLNPQKTGDKLLATVFDQIDGGSQRLLPLLHYNLNNQLPGDLILTAIKGYNRYVWSKNQVIFFQVKKIIALLQTNEIEHFFVKGVPLAKHYYGSDGIRPMSDLDFVVKEKDLENLWKVLNKEGWYDKYTSQTVNYKKLLVNSRCLVNNKDNEIDTHWRVFKDSFKESDEEEIWNNLEEFKVDDTITKTLNPTFQLLHSIIHGMRWNELPSFRWICDSLIIINKRDIQWENMLAFSAKRKYGLRLSAALTYLRDQFNADIPNFVFEELRKIKISKTEKKFFEKLTHEFTPGGFSNILLRHYQFQLYHSKSNLFYEGWVFLNHHSANWGTKNIISSFFKIIGYKTGLIQHPSNK